METSSLRTLKIMPRNLNEIVRSWIWFSRVWWKLCVEKEMENISHKKRKASFIQDDNYIGANNRFGESKSESVFWVYMYTVPLVNKLLYSAIYALSKKIYKHIPY